jgi:ankyrin repeat protein
MPQAWQNLDSKHGYHGAPLSHAANRGHVGVAKLLLDSGKVDANLKSNFSQTLLSHAAENTATR